MKIRPLGKFIIFILVLGAAYGGYRLYDRQKSGGGAASVSAPTKAEAEKSVLGRPMVVALNEWPGFVGGLFANGGLDPNTDSIYYQKGKLLVQFKIMLDPVAMGNAFARGDVDVMWQTIDTVPTVNAGLKKGGNESKVFMQCDWSRGGDAIVATKGINSVEDLAGKKVALIQLSPSDYLLQYGLRNSSLSESQQKSVLQRAINMDTPDKLQQALVSGNVSAIVTWEPNISATLESGRSKGAHVILSTETVSSAIADVFMAKEDFIQKHPDAIKAFVEGWFEGTTQANREPQKAIQIVMNNMETFKSLGSDKTADTFAKVTLTDLSHNAKTFGLDGGKSLYDTVYDDALDMYSKRGILEGRISAADSKNISQLKQVYAAIKPEERTVIPQEEFQFSEKQKEKVASKPAVMTKPVNIYFGTGSAALDPNAKGMLKQVVDLLRVSSNAYIRIEGNTDSIGGAASNVQLSQRRAQAVRNFLVASGFDPNRFIVKGNGPYKPVASNSTEAGRSRNRRTDIQVIAK